SLSSVFDTATTMVYTLSLHDALPISGLIAGILVGLAFGGWLATIGGAVGGLIGAAVAFNLATLAGVSNDFIVLAVLLAGAACGRSEEHTSELQSRENLVCRLLLEKKK